MKKIIISSLISTLLMAGLASAASERVDGFICPVFNQDSQAGAQNPNAEPIGGGDYTILGPDVMVPINATNQDGDGSPGGSHASPGKSTYTPIWNLD